MEQLFGALPKIMDGMELDPAARSAVVFAAWRRICGQLIKERTAAVDFAEGRLKVAVEDKTWQRHLEDMAPQMVAKLNSVLGNGSVRFIEFIVDGSAVASRVTPGSDDVPATAELDPGLRAAADAIADEHLRESFLKTAALYLARQKRRIAAS